MASGLATAGTYMQSADEMSYSATLAYSTSSDYWDRDGNLNDLGCTSRRQSLFNSLDYGYSYYHTLFGGFGLTRAQCGDRTRFGLGDLRAGIRGRINRHMNHRTWELVATVPTRGSESGQARIGCGAFGLAAGVGRQDELSRWFTVAGESSLRLWEAPLVHQIQGDLRFSGPISFRSATTPLWSWGGRISHTIPLEEATGSVAAVELDCGTAGQVIRLGTSVTRALSRVMSVNCGVDAAVWGEDTSRNRSVHCGISRAFR